MSNAEMKIDHEIINYGRDSKLFVTTRVAGQYYYATFEHGTIRWIRQTHEEEVKPLIETSTRMLIQIANAILGRDDKEKK